MASYVINIPSKGGVRVVSSLIQKTVKLTSDLRNFVYCFILRQGDSMLLGQSFSTSVSLMVTFSFNASPATWNQFFISLPLTNAQKCLSFSAAALWHVNTDVIDTSLFIQESIAAFR